VPDFGEAATAMTSIFSRWCSEIREGHYPAAQHEYAGLKPKA
jgi:hypothetical protein